MPEVCKHRTPRNWPRDVRDVPRADSPSARRPPVVPAVGAGTGVALQRPVRASLCFALFGLYGCSALVSPDVGRLGDAGPTGADAATVRPDGGACPGTAIACGAACVDPASDVAHCGGCDHACAPAESCVSGICLCPAGDPACAAPPLGNPDRCGGRSCRSDQVCRGDTCVCRPGLTAVGDRCVDLASDPDNCGMVGNACPEVCAGGVCAPRCSGGLRGCEGACVDLSSDPLHCGECGRSCARDQVCVEGRCRDYGPATSCDACRGDTPTCCDYATSTICVSGDGCP
ncbi:MAG: hypothetical protein KC619_15630 [Myxococcales bacterium]|nr:hypothetical protein [Myxococcales bacterium]